MSDIFMEDGRVRSGPGSHASHEAPADLRPAGFDPSRLEATKALADWCGHATEPSYELDLAIAEWCYHSGGIAGVNYDPKLWIERNEWRPTISLDAAASLVPEGWTFEHQGQWRTNKRDRWKWRCGLGSPKRSHKGWPKRSAECFEAYGLALSMCAAALRAHAITIEAGTAETAGLGAKHESVGPQGIAKTTGDA